MIPQFPVPTNSQGTPYVWSRRVKVFEANNVAALDSLINAFLATLESTQEFSAVLGYTYAGTGTGNNTRVLLDYGYFSPPA